MMYSMNYANTDFVIYNRPILDILSLKIHPEIFSTLTYACNSLKTYNTYHLGAPAVLITFCSENEFYSELYERNYFLSDSCQFSSEGYSLSTEYPEPLFLAIKTIISQ